MFGLAVLSVALVAGQVAASAISTRSPLAGLLRIRQASFDPSEVPAACQSSCSTISTALTSTTCSQDIDCLCSSATSTGLFDCLQCALNLQPDQDVLEQAQESYDEYAAACASGDVPVASQTLSLPSGSSASATRVSGSATATAAGSRTSTAAGRTSTAADPTETSTSGDDDGDDDSGDDSDSDDDSNSSSTGAQRNGARVGVAVSSVGLAGVAAMMAFFAL
ncbi:uncharacterized protein TRAVEDRAFT_53037 [Trametes versicolor FP-101664 SS1]|uniref:uncharacterized protein n=1 Tax=Trametes versicolor (strain FP-101664) TaxID=717944 RepID=UPI00046240D6|nr:uncharacterized protein TRAVEDRAFT_53037 [Trametes versicolor FP-101664 SS1]EIW52594.1 hypothetical protein TRAVEDRAFT_53037 [Trametes versicolor FP-101664 SS1]